MSLDPVKNFAVTTVDGAYSAADTDVNVTAGTGALFPIQSTDGSFNVVWWNFTDYPDASDDPNKEIVRVVATAGDAFKFTRAQENTAATAKNISGKVYKIMLAMTKKTVDDIQSSLDGKLDNTATTDDITEGSTNEYFTPSRAVAALNGANISSFTNDSGYITQTSKKLKGIYKVLGSTTFAGSGLNDVTFSGVYTGTGNPTYTYTITSTTTQKFSIATTTGWNVGDSIRGNTGSHPTGTILRIVNGLALVAVLTGSFIGQTGVTDTTTSVSKSISRPGAQNLGTFTDGTTTQTNSCQLTGDSFNGITYSVGSATGHTLTDSWSASVADILDDTLSVDSSTSRFGVGDSNNRVYGNQIYTDINNGQSRFFMRDAAGIYFEIDRSAGTVTFPGLAGGAGQYMAVDSSGNISPSMPLALGQPIGGGIGSAGPILFADAFGNLSKNDGLSFSAATGQFLIGAVPDIYFQIYGSSGFYEMGDLSDTHSHTKSRVNDSTMSILQQANSLFQHQDSSGNIYFKNDLGAQIYSWGAPAGVGHSTSITLQDALGLLLLSPAPPQYASDTDAITAGLTTGNVYAYTDVGTGRTSLNALP